MLFVAPAAATAAGWGARQVVYEGSAGNVRAGIDAAGNGVVAFNSPFGQAPSGVWVTDVPAFGSPRGLVRLSAESEPATLRALAVAPDGQAAVAWEQGGYRQHQVMIATRAERGIWSSPRQISRPGGHNALSDLVIEPGGMVVAAWTRSAAGAAPLRGRPRVEIARVTDYSVEIKRLPVPSTRPALATSEAFPQAAVVYERPRTAKRRDVLLRAGDTRTRIARLRSRSKTFARSYFVAPVIAAGAELVAAAALRHGFAIARVTAGGNVSRERVSAEHFGPLGGLAVAGTRAVLGFTQLEPQELRIVDSGVKTLDAGGDFASLAGNGGRIAAVWRAPHPSGEPGAWAVRGAFADGGQPFGAPEQISAPDEWLDLSSNPYPRLALNAAGAGLAVYVGRNQQSGAIPGRVTVVRLSP
jgi:hypothetical protein